MVEPPCKGVTVSGTQCQRQAGPSGFCHLHDPGQIVAREDARRIAEKKSGPLNQVLEVLTSECEAKGWQWTLESIDRQDWRHATFSVKRDVPTSGFRTAGVVGLCEVTVDQGVRLVLEKTSFYGHGLSELREALRSALFRLPWIKPKEKMGSVQITGAV
jgi:hypothetical protein